MRNTLRGKKCILFCTFTQLYPAWKEEDVIRIEKRLLGGCAIFGLKEVTVLRHLRLGWNSNSMRKCWEYGRLEWKKTFGLINLEPSRLVVVLPEENLEKHGIN